MHNKICYCFFLCVSSWKLLFDIHFCGISQVGQQTDSVFPLSVAQKAKVITTTGHKEGRALPWAASGAVLMVSGEANLLQITACGYGSVYAPACCQQRAVHEWS